MPELGLSSYWLGNLGLSVHIAFTLEDGSVIVGFSSVDKASKGSQVGLFEGLKPGGALPALPIVIDGLTSVGAARQITYAGRHLAQTKQGERMCEWGIYVPAETPGPRETLLAYRCVLKFMPPEREVPGSIYASVNVDLVVRADDFDTFVRGAMAELSDAGAPEHVTYEGVMRLAREIRQSLQGK